MTHAPKFPPPPDAAPRCACGQPTRLAVERSEASPTGLVYVQSCPDLGERRLRASSALFWATGPGGHTDRSLGPAPADAPLGAVQA